MAYSRYSRLEERRTKRQLFGVLIVITVVLILLFTVGVRLIIGLSDLISNLNNKNPATETGDKTPPFPPTLVPLTVATNSAILKLQGFAEPESTLNIFVNSVSVKKLILGTDGSFSYSEKILKEGNNSVFAKTTDAAGNESLSSNELHIKYQKKGPKLELSEPQENQVFTKNQSEIIIKGTTESGSSVYINDRFVSVNEEGSFNFPYKLTDGDNLLQIKASDQAGNETKLERKITYSP